MASAAAPRPRSLVLGIFFAIIFLSCNHHHNKGKNACLFFASAAPAPRHHHPLDHLTLAEMHNVQQVVNTSKHQLCGSDSPDSLPYYYVALEEPDKAALLSYFSGRTKSLPPRRGLAVVRCHNSTHDVTVDLTTLSISSDTIHTGSGFPHMGIDDYNRVVSMLNAYPPYNASLTRRRLDLRYVFCGPQSAGWDGVRGVGRRLFRIVCAYSPDGRSGFFRPMEGIMAVVDPDAMKIIRYADKDVVPVPTAAGADYRAVAQKKPRQSRKGGNAVPQ